MNKQYLKKKGIIAISASEIANVSFEVERMKIVKLFAEIIVNNALRNYLETINDQKERKRFV